MESKTISNEFFMPAIKELIDSGKNVKLTITGTSMLPLLRHEIDMVELGAFSGTLRIGDIVLIKQENGAYVLHRTITIDEYANTFHMVGDAQVTVEGPLRYDQIVAIVLAYHKKGKRREVTNFMYKIYIFFWMKTKRFRPRILRTLRKLRIIP